MRFGSGLRGEFPRGWWRSAHWWITGIRELALSTVAAVTSMAFVGEMVRAVRHRDEPSTLARLAGTFEGYVSSILVNGAGLGVLVAMAIEDDLPVVLTVLLTGWCLSNIGVSAVVFVVVPSRGFGGQQRRTSSISSSSMPQSTADRRRRSRSTGRSSFRSRRQMPDQLRKDRTPCTRCPRGSVLLGRPSGTTTLLPALGLEAVQQSLASIGVVTYVRATADADGGVAG